MQEYLFDCPFSCKVFSIFWLTTAIALNLNRITKFYTFYKISLPGIFTVGCSDTENRYNCSQTREGKIIKKFLS